MASTKNKRGVPYLVLPGLVVWCLVLQGCIATVAYKAAVYEHAVILPEVPTSRAVSRSEALTQMKRNLDIYQQQAELASQQGADILVFPEDGVYGMKLNRLTIKPFLEYIPDPHDVTWTPCKDPDKFPDTDVQTFLSCLARNNSIYIVANIGDRKSCRNETDEKCPPDGQYQYNTNVVFDKDGTLVARYHKQNLFFEYQFDTPKSVELSYFDTPFGRFGTFICFDIFFKGPAISLIERFNVTNIVFPTAWMDALPLLSSIQFHSAFAAGMDVNFLAANIHRPSERFHGSGIYTPAGALKFTYDDLGANGRLLVADISAVQTVSKPLKFQAKRISDNLALEKSVPVEPNQFQSYLFNDSFNFVPIVADTASLTVCHNKLCCHLEYNTSSSMEGFAFGAFDGLHTYEGQYYLQICVLLKCANADKNSCGSVTRASTTTFDMFTITGSFETPYVFPEILLTDTNSQLHLAPIGQWQFSNRVLTGSKFSNPLLSAALFGRMYSRDTGFSQGQGLYNIEGEIIVMLSALCLYVLVVGR